MTGRIFVMRHGRTHSNAGAYFDTVPPGAELTVIGRDQAIAGGRTLATLTSNLGRAVSSVALRAQQTMLLAVTAYEGRNLDAPGVGLYDTDMEVVTGIHEMAAGNLEKRNDPAAQANYLEALDGWLQRSLTARMGDGETGADLLQRAVPVLEQCAAYCRETGRDILVVSHGAAIRMLGAHGTDISDEILQSLYIANGSLAIFEPTGEFGAWHCARWADVDLDEHGQRRV